MSLTDFLEKFGRTVFEAPFHAAAGEPPEMAEVRLAILDEVRAKSYRSGGRKVFPYNRVRVHVDGVEESRQSVFTGRFFRGFLEHELRQSLERAGSRFPEDLRVEVTVSNRLPGPREPWLTVASESRDSEPGAARAPRLVVVEGKANLARLLIAKPRINIGRHVDVYRSEGIYRRNDIAFAEDTPANRSVSREHAHLTWERRNGECRLFNDRWYRRDLKEDCAIRIVRDGLSQEVHRTGRGTKLESGDEIHLGQAILRFEA